MIFAHFWIKNGLLLRPGKLLQWKKEGEATGAGGIVLFKIYVKKGSERGAIDLGHEYNNYWQLLRKFDISLEIENVRNRKCAKKIERRKNKFKFDFEFFASATQLPKEKKLITLTWMRK
jgi:hypothetical protein